MKKIFILILIMMMTLIPQVVSAANNNYQSNWRLAMSGIYIQGDKYYPQMKSAVMSWLNAIDKKIMPNISNKTSKQKNANIEFVFNNGKKEGIIQEGIRKGKHYMVVNVNTNKVKPELLNVKFLHYSGIALGLSESSNENSVMFNKPFAKQKILPEDINKIRAIYGLHPKK